MSFKPLTTATFLFLLAGCVENAVSTQNGSPTASTTSSGCVIPASASANVALMQTMINAERRKAGLPPVAVSPAATRAAQSFACDMSARNDISHIGADGSNMADRLAHVGIKIWVAAENTANGYTTVDRTMAAWMASAGHRDNILTPEVTQIGVGQALGSYPTWVLILFKPR